MSPYTPSYCAGIPARARCAEGGNLMVRANEASLAPPPASSSSTCPPAAHVFTHKEQRAADDAGRRHSARRAHSVAGRERRARRVGRGNLEAEGHGLALQLLALHARLQPARPGRRHARPAAEDGGGVRRAATAPSSFAGRGGGGFVCGWAGRHWRNFFFSDSLDAATLLRSPCPPPPRTASAAHSLLSEGAHGQKLKTITPSQRAASLVRESLTRIS